jgi:hypothetical protein
MQSKIPQPSILPKTNIAAVIKLKMTQRKYSFTFMRPLQKWVSVGRVQLFEFTNISSLANFATTPLHLST